MHPRCSLRLDRSMMDHRRLKTAKLAGNCRDPAKKHLAWGTVELARNALLGALAGSYFSLPPLFPSGFLIG